jgi:hypothetical protein
MRIKTVFELDIWGELLHKRNLHGLNRTETGLIPKRIGALSLLKTKRYPVDSTMAVVHRLYNSYLLAFFDTGAAAN